MGCPSQTSDPPRLPSVKLLEPNQRLTGWLSFLPHPLKSPIRRRLGCCVPDQSSAQQPSPGTVCATRVTLCAPVVPTAMSGCMLPHRGSVWLWLGGPAFSIRVLWVPTPWSCQSCCLDCVWLWACGGALRVESFRPSL